MIRVRIGVRVKVRVRVRVIGHKISAEVSGNTFSVKRVLQVSVVELFSSVSLSTDEKGKI